MQRIIAAGVLAGALGVSAVVSAAAEPEYPSVRDIKQAHAAEAAAGNAVAAIEARLEALNAQAVSVYITAAKAVEAYNGARIQLAEAKRTEARARERAQRMAIAAEQARIDLGKLAAAAYSKGGELSTMRMLLGVDTGQALYDGFGALRTVTASQAITYQHAVETTRAAEHAARLANEALVARRAAVDETRHRRQAAEHAVAEQDAAITAIEARQNVALAELAQARGTTVELERQRERGIAAEVGSSPSPTATARPTVTPTPDPTMAPTAEPTRKPSTTPSDPVVPTPTPSLSAQPTLPSSPRPTPVPSNTAKPTPLPAPPSPAPPRPSAAPPPVPPAPPPAPSPAPPPAPEPPPAPPEPISGAQAAVSYARAQLGKAYEWGADGPDTFDCSGLTERAWEAGGVNLPHWSVGQAKQTTRVSYADLQPGDLIFWSDNGKASGVYHVALYIGDGEMIHAPRPGKVVEVQDVFYWIPPAFYGRVS